MRSFDASDSLLMQDIEIWEHQMGTDYTVIQPVRQRFGDNPSGLPGKSHTDWEEQSVESEAPFVGLAKDFPFQCPSVDRSQWAVLQFNSLGVSTYDNVIQVNGVNIPGGISVGPSWPFETPYVPLWNNHSLLVEPGVLGEQNILHIASGSGGTGNHDDFLIDNVVIWFKTHTSNRPPIDPPNMV